MLFTLSGANCLSAAQNTRPVLFIMMILSCKSVPGARCNVTKSPNLSQFIYFIFFFFLLHLPVSPDLLGATLMSFYLFSPSLASLPNLSSISLPPSLRPLLLLSNFLARLSFPLPISPLFIPAPRFFLFRASLSFICLSFLFAPLSRAPLH